MDQAIVSWTRKSHVHPQAVASDDALRRFDSCLGHAGDGRPRGRNRAFDQPDGDGILLVAGADANRIERNTVLRNGDLGIEAVSGVVDGGRNRAHGNGNPLQCTNVVCG